MAGRKKIILNQLKNIINSKPDGINILLTDNINQFYVLYEFDKISSAMDRKELKGLEVLCKFTIPSEFPHKAVDCIMLTPNGIVKHDSQFCLDITNFHQSLQTQEKNRLDLHINCYATAIITWDLLDVGINLIWKTIPYDDQVALITKLSRDSKQWNKDKYESIIQKIRDESKMKDTIKK